MKSHTAMLLLLLLGGIAVRADQIEMENGDRYAGKVLSVTTNAVVLESDVLGKLTLPRGKVARINLGPGVRPSIHPTNAVAGLTNGNSRLASAMRNLGAESNVVEIIRQQYLADAGPEANSKFDELASGLFTGKLDIEKLRTEAKSAADQLRVLKQTGDVGEPFNSYLAVLDKFLKDSAPPPAPVAPAQTNSPATNASTSIILIR
jgi:hypothetical protein